MATAPHPQTDRFDRRAWAALLVLCGALFLDGLDVSMVGVALPSIDDDLDLSTSTLQWVVSGYVLGYGGLLLLGGRAADLLGRRRVFIAALDLAEPLLPVTRQRTRSTGRLRQVRRLDLRHRLRLVHVVVIMIVVVVMVMVMVMLVMAVAILMEGMTSKRFVLVRPAQLMTSLLW